jgi:hypothetical protein
MAGLTTRCGQNFPPGPRAVPGSQHPRSFRTLTKVPGRCDAAFRYHLLRTGTVRAPTELPAGQRAILFASGKKRAQVVFHAQDDVHGSATL